ncbi:MAG: biotin-dependent carboxyltransferase family protein [Lachnospiraceae bacterium]|nr:biotin-dependent carboxyltransferase family protein [Candidatus Equihabitans merdae]
MGFKFERSGPMTTVQDLGRYGYQKDGFSVSGVMDRRSAITANFLVGNEAGDPVLEFLLIGPRIMMTSDAVIAVTGGDFTPKINGQPMPMYEAVAVKKGDRLDFNLAIEGLWGYIAVANKLDIPLVMGSYSTNMKCEVGGFKGRKLKNDDEIDFREGGRSGLEFVGHTIEKEYFGDMKKDIRVVLGPQDDAFTEEGIKTFFEGDYVVTNECDRMGYRLDGPVIEHKGSADIISDGIPYGTIQVPSSGKPIVMLTDRQTTGGYTKIGSVVAVDMPQFVQSKQGCCIRFVPVTVGDAQYELRKYEASLKALIHEKATAEDIDGVTEIKRQESAQKGKKKWSIKTLLHLN